MSTPLANLVRQLGSAGCSIEQIAIAVESQEQIAIEAARLKSEQGAARQARYRAAKALRDATLRNVTSHDVLVGDKQIHQQTQSDSPEGQKPLHIDRTLTKDIKKVSKKTISAPLLEVPLDASEPDRTYAESKGWDHRKTASEWERFRNHSIANGKKHRNVQAAWRNWVTSPYQSTGAANGSAARPNGRPPSAITAALEQHTRDIANSLGDSSEARPAPPRLIANGRG